MARNKILTTEIVDGELRISIGLDVLKWAAEHSPDERLTVYDEKTGKFFIHKIEDLEEFARDVVCALEWEDEDGTTPIHILFDNAFSQAIENGSLGVSEDLDIANERRMNEEDYDPSKDPSYREYVRAKMAGELD